LCELSNFTNYQGRDTELLGECGIISQGKMFDQSVEQFIWVVLGLKSFNTISPIDDIKKIYQAGYNSCVFLHSKNFLKYSKIFQHNSGRSGVFHQCTSTYLSVAEPRVCQM
jgi:hypothetical protein